ncbi:zinc finger protein 521-like [Manduca sexta]|uniref:zinc finger protein 521-like n=1 Tax=Manduca sexta TaxID=7130 RepID=UPI00188E9F24|nr:zinc finger protein 521-like [Manduca sexta]
MSVTKLTINKYENCSNSKYMNVIIEEDGITAETKFGDWIDGINEHKKKNTEKSSRLVVKIISEDETNEFNLDSCAREVDDINKYLCTNKILSGNILQDDEYKACTKNFNSHECEQNSLLNNNNIKGRDDISEKIARENDTSITESQTYDSKQYLSPLEHSLEKVKENNARIMENIHLLNRTLNYTKKKEILDIVSPKSMPSYSCNTCGKCFVYETGLRRHYSMRHAFSEIQPRWQVVWTCVQCFQVWPSQDQAMKHILVCCKSDNPEYVREIKTSSLLQCEFCEKVFTSIPRLLRHFKTHTTANNYKCNACGNVFLSYKSAEQHWLLCPWLKVYYSFSLPKLLLCNACDRKFRNYDQLYNHRYKFGHFISKIHNSEEGSNSVGTLVYQCEICGLWYLSPMILKAHRNQYHPHTDDSILPGMNKSITQDYTTQNCEFHID